MPYSRHKNSVTLNDDKFLVETLHVTPISSNVKNAKTMSLRIRGSPKNFREFKSVYEENIKYSAEFQDSDTSVSKSYCNVDPVSCPFKRVKETPRQALRNLLFPRLKPIKTVRAQIPKGSNKNAIVKLSKYTSSTPPPPRTIMRSRKSGPEKRTVDIAIGSTHEFIEKLKQLDLDKDESNDDLVQQANKEIDIASTQIEQIKDLLKSKVSAEASTEAEAEEEEEEEVTAVEEKNEIIKPQWNTKRNKVEGEFSVEKNKVLVALNTLNRKLQRMQDKYFKQPHVRYRSILDTSSKSVEFIYKNRNFTDATVPKNNDVHSKSFLVPRVTPTTNTTDLRNAVLSELRENKCKVFVENPTDFEPRPWSSDKKRPTRIPVRTPVLENPYNNQDKVEEKVVVKSDSHQGDVVRNRSAATGNDKDNSMLNNIEQGVQKSTYLTKEFTDAKSNFLEKIATNIHTLRQKTTLQANRNVPSALGFKYPSMGSERALHLRNTINAALKNSLYESPCR